MAKLRARVHTRPAWFRLARAASRAHDEYLHAGAPATRGFYHGLLTGYAVAIKALQGKVTAPRAPARSIDELVDEAGRESFPASDPPAWHVPRVDARHARV